MFITIKDSDGKPAVINTEKVGALFAGQNDYSININGTVYGIPEHEAIRITQILLESNQ